MKSAKIKMVVLSLLVFSEMSYAENITASDPDEEHLPNGKLQCIYDHGDRVYSYITNKSTCDYSHTFDTSQAE